MTELSVYTGELAARLSLAGLLDVLTVLWAGTCKLSFLSLV